MKNDKLGRRILPNLLNPPAPDPVPLFSKSDEPDDPDIEEAIKHCWDYSQQEEDEIEAIKASRPLGTVVHREPKSLHYSKVPDPVWKRKLRP